jgi:hypothetical protein
VVVGGIAVELFYNRGGRFLKNVLIFEKKGGADAFENDPAFRSKPPVREVPVGFRAARLHPALVPITRDDHSESGA